MEQERLEQELLKGLRSNSRLITPKEWEKLTGELKKQAVRAGLDTMTNEEINDEIKAARQACRTEHASSP
jgi:hypothetical protein